MSTLLRDLIVQEKFNEAKLLILSGYDINSEYVLLTKIFRSFMGSSENHIEELALLLINSGYNFKELDGDFFGEQLLNKCHIKILKAVLDRGYNPNKHENILRHSQTNYECAKELVKAGYNIKQDFKYIDTLLDYGIIELFIENGYSFSDFDELYEWEKTTLLSNLCKENTLHILEALLKIGADLNSATNLGNSRKKPVLLWLIKNGYKHINLGDIIESTKLSEQDILEIIKAAEKYIKECDEDLLVICATANRKDIANYLIEIGYEAPVNQNTMDNIIAKEMVKDWLEGKPDAVKKFNNLNEFTEIAKDISEFSETLSNATIEYVKATIAKKHI